METQLELQLVRQFAAVTLDIGQGLVAVDLRLALAEQVEVGTVQEIDETAHDLFSPIVLTCWRRRQPSNSCRVASKMRCACSSAGALPFIGTSTLMAASCGSAAS